MDAAAFPGARHLGGHWDVTGIDWEDAVQLFLVRLLEKLLQLFRPFVFQCFLMILEQVDV
jgi:hypothetical protein